MKFSLFTFERAAAPPARGRSGDVIKSAVVQPHHAEVLRQARRQFRMYDAAATDHLSADFPVTLSSANAEILTSALAARSRARRLERDNPYAWAILNAFQNNVVGDDPFRLQMRVGKRDAEGKFVPERDTNQIIEEWWQDVGAPEYWTVRRDMSRTESYLQAISALVRDGGILWRKWRGFPKSKYGYACQPLEVDRLDHNYNQPAVGSNRPIQFGIETDAWEGVEAFWILNRHPGDVFAWSQSPRYRDRIPADEVIALWDIRTRAGQYIGMPRFVSIIKRLHREDQWDVAYVTAAIYAACKQIYLQREEAAPEYEGDESREGEKFETVEPAVARILPPGYKPIQMDPKFPLESSSGFKKDNLRAIGSGAGLAYHSLANDLEGVNFSSGRLGENAQRDEFRKLQAHMITNLVRPDFNERLRYAILSGQLPLDRSRVEEFQRAARFTGKRWPYVNPLQDVQTELLRIEGGLDSRQRIIAESDRGGTAEDVCAEQASDNEVAELHGLEFGEGATPPARTEDDPPEGKEDDPPKPPAKTGGKQTLKKSRERLDRTLRVLAVSGETATQQRNGHL